MIAVEKRIDAYVWMTQLAQTDQRALTGVQPSLLVSALRYRATKPAWAYLSVILDKDIEVIDLRRQIDDRQQELTRQQQVRATMASLDGVPPSIMVSLSALTALELRLN